MIDSNKRFQVTYKVIDETIISSHDDHMEASLAFASECVKTVIEGKTRSLFLHDDKPGARKVINVNLVNGKATN